MVVYVSFLEHYRECILYRYDVYFFASLYYGMDP